MGETITETKSVTITLDKDQLLMQKDMLEKEIAVMQDELSAVEANLEKFKK